MYPIIAHQVEVINDWLTTWFNEGLIYILCAESSERGVVNRSDSFRRYCRLICRWLSRNILATYLLSPGRISTSVWSMRLSYSIAGCEWKLSFCRRYHGCSLDIMGCFNKFVILDHWNLLYIICMMIGITGGTGNKICPMQVHIEIPFRNKWYLAIVWSYVADKKSQSRR